MLPHKMCALIQLHVKTIFNLQSSSADPSPSDSSIGSSFTSAPSSSGSTAALAPSFTSRRWKMEYPRAQFVQGLRWSSLWLQWISDPSCSKPHVKQLHLWVLLRSRRGQKSVEWKSSTSSISVRIFAFLTWVSLSRAKYNFSVNSLMRIKLSSEPSNLICRQCSNQFIYRSRTNRSLGRVLVLAAVASILDASAHSVVLELGATIFVGDGAFTTRFRI